MWLWPHLLHPREVPDRGDPVFSAWRIARFAHQLRYDPAHLFDGNIFYPRRWTLAYSDATVLEGLVGTPFVLAGADPLVVANALFFVAFPLCGLAFFWSGWKFTGDLNAGLVAGVLGAWYPFHGEHYSHLELQWFMFVPLAFVTALEILREPHRRNGALLAALIALQCLASMYLGLMLVCALMALIAAGLGRRRAMIGRRLAAFAVTAAVLVPFVVAIGWPYERARAAHGERSIGEIAQGSATASDYLHTSRRLATYAWHERAHNVPERELYPGTSTLSLAAIGILTPPFEVVVPLATAAVAAFDWSRGLNGLTYRALVAAVPPFRSVRVPARFGVIVGSALILLGALGAHRLVSRGSPARQIIVTALLVAAILFDLRLTVSLMEYPAIPSIDSRLTADAIVAEFPLGHEIDYMYFSTSNWQRLLTGSSGFESPDPKVMNSVTQFPDVQAIAVLRALGATHLIYNCAYERSPERCDSNVAALAEDPNLVLVGTERWLGATVRLYRFR